jgi:hypothetical protein
MHGSAEAEEVRVLLCSEVFLRSPNLARLLKYLCSNHFSEKKEHLNEYRIGVEALGRSSDFDPAKNSSVRVEVHRLREKLGRYYETEGLDHAYRIEIEDGRYALHFVRQDDSRVAPSGELQEFKEPSESLKRRFFTSLSAKVVAGAGLSLTIVVFLVSALVIIRSRGTPANGLVASVQSASGISTAATADTSSVRILAGYLKEQYIDREGRVWSGDRYFTGGEAVEQSFPFLQGTTDPTMFRTARTGEFRYEIPLKPGKYELRLHFAETAFGPGTLSGRGESSRVFTVFLGEQPLLDGFDVLSSVGSNNLAYTRVFKDISAGGDGKIHLRFHRTSDEPFVNAIELVPETHNRMNPVRILAQESSFVDHAGQLWEPDQFASGGILVTHLNAKVGTDDPHLFDGERYGHFIYQIPVATPGRYTVTLHFAETFLGTASAATVVGSGTRVFDVYANGVALLRNLNIVQETGGPNKPLTKTFHGIEPNAAGLIVLSFIPVKNYACVNAIEVTDESP